ncbi:hypothetical protein HHE02_10510 [Helicobacter heilmannii]|nr:hypothetical protein HHE014_10960 [Helicobacter heilmannii]CRF47756.1 hypothetical protein HHE02_10510 [Helicobacter heilmannii]CRF49227.1 hypothetical protein HHE03_08260 [Helicobacter heilmannii]CRF50847.1 hypothetical protein HHE06_07000 [Helicobacter heilmannii]BDQ27917.1 hypothetical protein ASB1_15930 [Helicobacter heilmannii]
MGFLVILGFLASHLMVYLMLQKGKEKFYGVGSVVVNGVLQPLDLATAKRKGLEELNAAFDEKYNLYQYI